jgi:hypothetical protein
MFESARNPVAFSIQFQTSLDVYAFTKHANILKTFWYCRNIFLSQYIYRNKLLKLKFFETKSYVYEYLKLKVDEIRRTLRLLCNDREMSGYTRAVSRQRLGKHIPVVRQQILNNATVGLQQWKSCDFYVVRAEIL